MKKIVFLPGNKQNKEWNASVTAELKKFSSQVTLQEYRHWTFSAPLIDLTYESDKVPACDIVVAKSAGIILALKAINEKKISPSFCLFMGFPLEWLKENRLPYEPYLKNFNVPVILIQNKNDPACSAENLKKLFKEHLITPLKFISPLRNDHHYTCWKEMRNALALFDS